MSDTLQTEKKWQCLAALQTNPLPNYLSTLLSFVYYSQGLRPARTTELVRAAVAGDDEPL